MKRTLMLAALALLAAALIILLAACSEAPEKHPIVAKWAQDFDEGQTRVMYSFEAIGDIEVAVWRYDAEVGGLDLKEHYWGEYTLDEDAGTVSITMANKAKETKELDFAYALSEKTLKLTNEEISLELNRVAENSANVK